MLRKSAVLLIAVFMAISLSACTQAPDEAAFKKAAKELRPLLRGIEKTPPKIYTGPEQVRKFYKEHGGTKNIPKEIKKLLESSDDIDRERAKGISIVDYDPQVEFYKNTQNEWARAAKALEGFCTKYPDSVWLDDAHVLLAYFVYVDKADESRKMHDIAKINMGIVTSDHKQLHLENWTLRNFDYELEKGLDKARKELLRPDISDDDAVYILNKYAFGLMLIDDGEKELGRKILSELAEQYRGSPLEALIRSDLDDSRRQMN